MSTIGFDIPNTFRNHRKQTVAKPQVDLCRFLIYCCFAIAFRLIFVIVCLTLEFTKARILPGYGMENICWLTKSVSLILFFIVPVFMSITYNVVFSITLYSIQHAMAKSSVRAGEGVTYYFVDIKMPLILGFTRSVGIISAFTSIDWLWYVHITLNDLQGLRLFCCTMANARTINPHLPNGLSNHYQLVESIFHLKGVWCTFFFFFFHFYHIFDRNFCEQTV